MPHKQKAAENSQRYSGTAIDHNNSEETDKDNEYKTERSKNLAAGDCTSEDIMYTINLKTFMADRGPNKRKIKPLPIYLNDIGEESSSDSDFQIKANSVDYESDSDRASYLTYSDDDDDLKETDKHNKDKTKYIKNITSECTSEETTNEDTLKIVNLKETVDQIHICSVCLDDSSDDVNKLIDCEKCGISVHKGCYGVNDSENGSLSVLSSTIQPWFCDTCKAGVQNITCELCPNYGGIFKETSCGKWVHLVCALYIPDVTFGEVTSLSNVMLLPNTSLQWGSKSCTLCDNVRSMRNGVTIKCDVGLCRSNFHVTCAQREGSLSDAASPQTDQSDPYYAHCKLHVDKNLAKKRKRNWEANQLKMRQMNLLSKEQSSEMSTIWQHNQQVLDKTQLEYYEIKKSPFPELIHYSKVLHPTMSSDSACQTFWPIASLMNINMTSRSKIIEDSIKSLSEVPKKWHIPPAFSSEYLGYFNDRNLRLTDLKKRLKHCIEQKKILFDKQTIVQEKNDQELRNHEIKLRKYIELRKVITAYHDVIQFGKPDARLPDLDGLTIKNNKVPLVLIKACSICCGSNNQHLLAKCDRCYLYYHLSCLNLPLTKVPKNKKSFIWQCNECENSISNSKQQELVNLEAPSPGKTSNGIEVKSVYNQDAVNSDFNSCTVQNPLPTRPKRITNVRRRDRYSPELIITKRIKPHQRKNKHLIKDDIAKIESTYGLHSKPFKKKMKLINTNDTKMSPQLLTISPVSEKPKISIRKNPKKSTGLFRKSKTLTKIKLTHNCNICSTTETSSTMVQCDECSKNFHFRCLNPPLKKSPKIDGYSWHCKECN